MMKGILLHIKGNWAQFKKPETSNNPLSHDFITKTALIGMIGAVIGKNRNEMKELFPILSEDLKYGVKINNDVKKQSWGFTFREVDNMWNKNPKQMEFIKDPDYDVIIALYNERSESIFNQFATFCKEERACYQPILGLHNCPAEIYLKAEGVIEYSPNNENRSFDTEGFVDLPAHQPQLDLMAPLRLGYDKIPSHQNNDFWNDPNKYITVIYPYNDAIKVSGNYYEFNKTTKWCMI